VAAALWLGPGLRRDNGCGVKPRFNALVSVTILLAQVALCISAHAEPLESFTVTDDAVEAPLGGHLGDAVRGERLVRDRERGNCLICHRIPVPEERFQGDLGPTLAGVGSRLSLGQLRLRLIDQTRINPDTIMPAYYRIDGLIRVAPRYQGKPALTAAEIEDVIAWLATLKE
jgi:L-cysteine S-thiosulfotransferase